MVVIIMQVQLCIKGSFQIAATSVMASFISKNGHPPMAVVPVPQSVTMVTAFVLAAQDCARCATSLIRPRHAKDDAAPSSMIHT